MVYWKQDPESEAAHMAKSENQKVKTLFVAKYFLENSDENHPITAGRVKIFSHFSLQALA